MGPLDAAWIARVLGNAWTKGTPRGISGCAFDSREIKPGELFVALRGIRHGHEFIETARQKGASGAIVEALQLCELPQIVVPDSLRALQKLGAAWRKDWGKAPTHRLCALTGSSGKTSTKELLAHLLGPATHKTAGNFNNHIGLPITLLGLKSEHNRAVVECGVNHPGEMNELAAICSPDAALLTNIGSAHLEFFKTKAQTAFEKGKLLQAVNPKGLVILHAHELQYPPLQKFSAKVLALGERPAGMNLGANYHFIPFSSSEETYGWRIKVGQEAYTLPLWTPGMVKNAALCIALARAWDISANEVASHLQTWPGVSLRGNWSHFEGSPASARLWFDAYNANPEAMADSLWKFQKTSREGVARLYILGTMGELGEDSDTLHQQTGALIPLSAFDEAWVVGTKASQLAQGLCSAGAVSTQIKMGATLDEIRTKLQAFSGDVFIKGSHATGLYDLANDISTHL
jgi:UDP-N-acetylmuramoyl-tripeptide--D-alanyl-D-alanine ligase